MQEEKHTIFHKKTIYIKKNKKANSPYFLNNKIKTKFLINENENRNKTFLELKTTQSIKDINQKKTSRSKKKFDINKRIEINLNERKKQNLHYPCFPKEVSKKINYIKKKITIQSLKPGFSKRNSNDNIFNRINTRNKIIKNNTKKIINSTEHSLNQKKNCVDKIDLNNKISYTNKKKFFYSSKLSISLDSILSKTLNKNQIKNKQKSFEKSQLLLEKAKRHNDKLSLNKINTNIFNKIKDCNSIKSNKAFNNNPRKTKINLEKNKKINRQNIKKKGISKSGNITGIIHEKTKSNLLNNNQNNPINDKKKNNDKINNKHNRELKKYLPKKYTSNKNNDFLNNSKENSDLLIDEFYNILNDPKFLGENNSTNDKSLYNRKEISNKKKIITPNILMNKYKDFVKNKISNNLLKDNDEFIEYVLDTDNEKIDKINGVKTNNFNIKKPKEENLKFTFMKNEKESEVSFSHPSKIIIGNIDGYKDIIETDIKNNKKTSIFNIKEKSGGEGGEFYICGGTKKFSNLSTLLKKENESNTFNDYNFYDSFNMTNNIDGISSSITNNIINDKKAQKINLKWNKNNDTIKIYNGIDFNNASFAINNDKSIEELSKIVNCSIIKGNNNFGNLTNNNSIKNLKYKNKNIYDKINREKNGNVNINCNIF